MILIGRWLYSCDPRPKLGEWFVSTNDTMFQIHNEMGEKRTGLMVRIDMDLLDMTREELLLVIQDLRNANSLRSK